MAELDFYHNKKGETDTISAKLSKYEEDQRSYDAEEWANMRNYRSRKEDFWRRAATAYNVIQQASPDDRVSNIFIGYARLIIDNVISSMSEGEPEFDFAPLGASDWKKIVLWESMMKMILSRSNYKSHQNQFLIDYHVMGTGVLEPFVELPMRTIRVPIGQDKFDEQLVRDYRRPKVGVRAVSPWQTWRNPNVSDPEDVPSSFKQEILTWNQFVQNYGRAKLQDGSPKYKNIDKLELGTHVVIRLYQNELTDTYRIYANSYMSEVEGDSGNPPDELGIPIFDMPLKIHETVKNGKTLRTDGHNIPGMTNLCFASYNDQYDSNYKTHDIYGMGIVQLVEGLDVLTQTLFNMNVDNWRLANTVLIDYQPRDGKSYLDFDSNAFYSGDIIDGVITPHSLGSVRLNDYPALQEVIDNLTIWATGVNFKQVVGDTSKTAFEFAQRIKANNRRAEQKIRVLENGCLKRLGTLLLAMGITELTVEDFEDLTEEQVEMAQEAISKGVATGEDFELSGGKPVKKRIRTHIPVEGVKLREDFSQSKTRRLDPNSTSNTLIVDKDLEGDVSYIPATKEYLYPAEYIESGIIPDVIVDGSKMLGDQKAQDIQTWQSIMNMGITLKPIVPEIDLKGMFTEFGEFGGIDESRLFEDADPEGEDIQKQVDQMETLVTGQAPGGPVEAVPPIDASGLSEQPELQSPQPPQALTNVAGS